MRKDTNRTFYFIETQEGGKNVYKVGSDFAPVWTNSFDTLNDAVEAVRNRNKTAQRFEPIQNGLVAVYVPTVGNGNV
jgi:hypothetical protein